MAVYWEQQINFASALLLHSCLTLLLKEAFNVCCFLFRLARRTSHHSSFTLDGYTSILSNDPDGALSELYFTNTGLLLLAVSLASSVVMNLFLTNLALNLIVAVTFGLTWVVSLASSRWQLVLPILALRRAGRFVWSDTPFVNFFSLIYIATALHGDSALHLRDYVIFRSIAIAELVFMKAYIAASGVPEQQTMVRALIQSEKVVMRAKKQTGPELKAEGLERRSIVAFTTLQRMSVMFFKTTPGHESGSVRGPQGSLTIPVPAVGTFVDQGVGWKMYRISEEMMLIVDNIRPTPSSGVWKRFIAKAHGVLLKQLGKVRVVYLLRETREDDQGEIETVWRSNINLVTGVSRVWLESGFVPGEVTEFQRLV